MIFPGNANTPSVVFLEKKNLKPISSTRASNSVYFTRRKKALSRLFMLSGAGARSGKVAVAMAALVAMVAMVAMVTGVAMVAGVAMKAAVVMAAAVDMAAVTLG